ncbi:peptidoglycan-binding protein, partial [Vibrio neptunius]
PLEYWLLDEKAALELEKESQQTDLLLNNYKTLLAKVPQGDTATPEALELHAREKEAWLKDAQYAGMFATAGTTQSRATKRVAQVAAAKPLANSNQARVNSELK